MRESCRMCRFYRAKRSKVCYKPCPTEGKNAVVFEQSTTDFMSVSMQAPASASDRGFTFGVFLANYNHAPYLPQALDALLAQTLQPDAICVVDDCSVDDSRAIILDYAARHPVIVPVFNEKNRGYIPNAGEWLASTSYDFLYFAAADDYTLPSFFEKTIALLRRHPDAGLCSSLCYVLDEGAEKPQVAPSPQPCTVSGFLSPRDAAAMLHRDGSWFWGTTTIYRRESALRQGGFDPALHGYCDGFLSSVIALREGACFIPEPLAVWRRFFTTSISAVTLKDVVRSRDTLFAVQQRLSGDLKGEVVPGYPRRFARRWLYAFLERQIANSADMDLSAVCDAVRPYAPLLARVLPLVLRLPCAAVRRTVLALALRPFDILPAMVRRVASAFPRIFPPSVTSKRSKPC